jgi:hypothetical protein
MNFRQWVRIRGYDHHFGHPLRLWETPFCAKTQLSRLIAETMVKAQSDKPIPSRLDLNQASSIFASTYYSEKERKYVGVFFGIAHFSESKLVNAMTLFEFSRLQ